MQTSSESIKDVLITHDVLDAEKGWPVKKFNNTPKEKTVIIFVKPSHPAPSKRRPRECWKSYVGEILKNDRLTLHMKYVWHGALTRPPKRRISFSENRRTLWTIPRPVLSIREWQCFVARMWNILFRCDRSYVNISHFILLNCLLYASGKIHSKWLLLKSLRPTKVKNTVFVFFTALPYDSPN